MTDNTKNMIDNIASEISRAGPERVIRTQIQYQPDLARKNQGRYFIDENALGYISEHRIARNLLQEKEIEILVVQPKKERKRNIWGKRIVEKEIKRLSYDDLLGEEGNQEIIFVNIIRHYHERLIKEIEVYVSNNGSINDKFYFLDYPIIS